MLNPNKGSCLLLLPKEYLNFFLCLLFIGTWRFSEKITPIAGNDLGKANGGKRVYSSMLLKFEVNL